MYKSFLPTFFVKLNSAADRPTKAAVSAVWFMILCLSSRFSNFLMHYSVNDALQATYFTLWWTFILDALAQHSFKISTFFKRRYNYILMSIISWTATSLYAMNQERKQLIAELLFKENNPWYTMKQLLMHRARYGTFTDFDMYSYPVGAILWILICICIIFSEEQKLPGK